MTDVEINLAIARIEYPNNILRLSARANTKIIHVDNHPQVMSVDYMEWFWIGPIIEREKIHLYYNKTAKEWEASSDKVIICDEVPMTAAALCYLEMKGVEI